MPNPPVSPVGFDSWPNREVLRAKFAFTNGTGTSTRVAAPVSHRGLSITDGGVGLFPLVFPRNFTAVMIRAWIDPGTTTQDDQRDCNVSVVNVAAGTATIITENKADAQADPTSGSVMDVEVVGFSS